jgi:hypothetical protein
LRKVPTRSLLTVVATTAQSDSNLRPGLCAHCLIPPEGESGFSRKIENHSAAVALNYFVYNFIRIHRTLRVTPAMAAGVTERLWEVSDLVALLEAAESKKAA